jgi:hypothetical protein
MALQGQCKALLDASHARCMTQLQGLLEAEQWVAVDVPAGFQVGGVVMFEGSLWMGLLEPLLVWGGSLVKCLSGFLMTNCTGPRMFCT